MTAVVGTLAVAQVVALGVAAYFVGRLGVPLRPAFDVPTMRRLLSSAPTFVSITVFATLHWRVDVVILSAIGSISDVGLYGAAYRIMDLVRILPQSLCMAVYPLVAHAAVTDLDRLRRVGTETLRFLAIVTIPMVVGGTILAGPLLAFTVGEEFRAAGPTLSVLLWTAIPYTFTRYYAYVIVGANHERVDLFLNVVLSAVNIALNVLLIPSYGSVGAAAATLISIVLFGTGQYMYLLRRLPGHLAPMPEMAKPIAAVAVMADLWWRGNRRPPITEPPQLICICVHCVRPACVCCRAGPLVRDEVASVACSRAADGAHALVDSPAAKRSRRASTAWPSRSRRYDNKSV